eukprot:EG_transcript_50207
MPTLPHSACSLALVAGCGVTHTIPHQCSLVANVWPLIRGAPEPSPFLVPSCGPPPADAARAPGSVGTPRSSRPYHGWWRSQMTSQMLRPRLSAVTAPSTWYAAVATAHSKPWGK